MALIKHTLLYTQETEMKLILTLEMTFRSHNELPPFLLSFQRTNIEILTLIISNTPL